MQPPITEHLSLHSKSLSKIWHARLGDTNNMHPLRWGHKRQSEKRNLRVGSGDFVVGWGWRVGVHHVRSVWERRPHHIQTQSGTPLAQILPLPQVGTQLTQVLQYRNTWTNTREWVIMRQNRSNSVTLPSHPRRCPLTRSVTKYVILYSTLICGNCTRTGSIALWCGFSYVHLINSRDILTANNSFDLSFRYHNAFQIRWMSITSY